MDGKAHLAEPYPLCRLLLPVDHDLMARPPLVPFHKPGALDEHAARPAGGVIDPTVERLYNINDEFDNRCGCKELTALFPSLMANSPVIRIAEKNES